jgi:hypothetical protein
MTQSIKVYYIIMSGGMPVDVTNLYDQARASQAQWNSRGRPAEILPVVPQQLELPLEAPESPEFLEEEPTTPNAETEKRGVETIDMCHPISECSCL